MYNFISLPTIINKPNLKQLLVLLLHYTCNRNEYCGNNYIYYRFLKEVSCNGNEKLLQNYLELHPDCSHLLAVLQHGCREQTDDITM